MSDSWIAWKPRIEEPSKPSPSSNTDWVKDDTGTVKCCMTPGRSQKRTSTISTPSSLTYFSSSSLLANICPPWSRTLGDRSGRPTGLQVMGPGRRDTAGSGCDCNVGRGSFPTVSPLFRPCNRCPRAVRGPCLGWAGEPDDPHRSPDRDGVVAAAHPGALRRLDGLQPRPGGGDGRPGLVRQPRHRALR